MAEQKMTREQKNLLHWLRTGEVLPPKPRAKRKIHPPFWTTSWRVDEAIECLPIGKDAERALLVVAPTAYHKDTPLSEVWNELDKETRKALSAAFRKEYGR